MNETIHPLVSVCIITYNHENYIRQAVESVLAQEINFPIEILIGEDLSTDSTRELVLELGKKYPQVIRTFLSPTNLGPNKNLAHLLQESRGRYIALLEGDDFWTSTQKLRKQTEFLEQHPECTICFHRVERYLQAEDRIVGVWPDFDPPAITSLEDLLKLNYIHTCSVMYRNVVVRIPSGYTELPIGDWPLHVLHAQKGSIGFLAETLSRYRIHSRSIFSPLTTLQKTEAVFEAREFMYPQLNRKHQKVLGPVLLEYCYQIAGMSLENQDIAKARRYLGRGLHYFSHIGLYNGREAYLKLYLKVLFPRVYSIGYRLKNR
jgi:glycosyltransferase involved in cell wall biosynthesis